LIAIVGSRDLPPTVNVVTAIASIMLAAPELEPYGVRSSQLAGVSSGVEQAVVRLCLKLPRTILAFPSNGFGREGVYHRDYALVEAATRVIAFFTLDGFMTGGTGHVVKAAMDRGIPVEAYALTDDGRVILLGGTDDH
jgi:hypothetical protein